MAVLRFGPGKALRETHPLLLLNVHSLLSSLPARLYRAPTSPRVQEALGEVGHSILPRVAQEPVGRGGEG